MKCLGHLIFCLDFQGLADPFLLIECSAVVIDTVSDASSLLLMTLIIDTFMISFGLIKNLLPNRFLQKVGHMSHGLICQKIV